MKKKFLALLLCLSTLNILAACGSNDSDDNNNSPIKNQVSEATSQNSLISDNYFNDKKITLDDVLNNDDDNDDNSAGNTVSNENSSNNTASSNNSAGGNNNSTINNNSVYEVPTTSNQIVYTRKFKNLNEYLANEDIIREIYAIKTQSEAQGLYTDIYGNYDSITFKSTAQTNMIPDDMTPENFKILIDIYMQQNKNVFQALINDLQTYVEVSPVKLFVEMYNFDNTLIYRGEYTAE